MMDFLHRHHESEDEWLYPQVRHRDPAAGPLLDTGLWIMDGLNEADRATVTGLVPPVPRWIITHLLAGRYRRAAYRRWRLAAHSPYKTPQHGQVEVTTAASPEAVWAVLADVTRVSGGSPSPRPTAAPSSGSPSRP
jgi:hypothetical protein